MCFPVSKKISGKFQSYKFQNCYGHNMQQMQILHELPKEEYLSLQKLLFIYRELH